MARFVDDYPEYRKMHRNVSKHVTMVTEMSRIVEKRKLMLVSQTEQELACNGVPVADFEVFYSLTWFLCNYSSAFCNIFFYGYISILTGICFYNLFVKFSM